MGPEFAALIARHVAGERFDVRAECARLSVSTTTFYKYVSKFKDAGVEGLYPRSRRPVTSPGRLDAACEDEIVRARKELLEGGWDGGADQIRFRLGDQIAAETSRWPAGQVLASRATINRVLQRRGQLLAVPQRRPRCANRRFEAEHPNGRWQMDGFRYQLSDTRVVTVLHIIDDCSRYEIALDAVTSENARDVWASVQGAAGRCGLPAQMLTDNGTAFSGRRRGWTSPLEANLVSLGVRHITSSVRHPQTCGKVERAHQPAQRWLDRHGPYDDLAALQGALDTYRHAFNHDRRKAHLNGLTPAQRYQIGPRAGPEGPITEPLVITTGKVSPVGAFTINRTRVGIGRRHANKTLTLFRRGQRITVFDANTLIVEFDLINRSGYQSANPNRHVKLSAKS